MVAGANSCNGIDSTGNYGRDYVCITVVGGENSSTSLTTTLHPAAGGEEKRSMQNHFSSFPKGFTTFISQTSGNGLLARTSQGFYFQYPIVANDLPDRTF